MAGIKWLKTYFAMLATPLEVTDVLYGHLLWILTRVALASGVFLAVMTAFTRCLPLGVRRPAAVLTGAPFSAPVMASVPPRETEPVVRRASTASASSPLFCSRDVFPVTQFAGWLQVIARCTALYQWRESLSSLVLGRPGGWMP